jgi:hypothetical protein
MKSAVPLVVEPQVQVYVPGVRPSLLIVVLSQVALDVREEPEV